MGPLAYIGSKRRLARRLMAWFPAHRTYVEPFCGAAEVFFHKAPSQVEVLNDLDQEVVNFLRVCQLHHPELLRYLEFTAASRQLYKVYRCQEPSSLTDVQRAARFLYLLKNSYGGKIVEPRFDSGVLRPSKYTPRRLPQLISAASRRLARATLECRPYEQILDRFDRETTLFYCDPPYAGHRVYTFNFSEEDFGILARRLAVLRGKFVLSMNDHPLVRKAFRDFDCQELAVTYALGSTNVNVGRGTELVFANFALRSQGAC